MQVGVGLLVSDVMPIYMIMPRYFHNYSLFINWSIVICSPAVILMLSWEKPLVKPMTPGSTLPDIIFPSTNYFCRHLFLQSLLSIYIIKIPKILILLLSSLSDLTLASGREGIDKPFIALVVRFLFVCVGTMWRARGVLLDWYLGSQKLREILMLLLLHHPFLFKENQRKLKT